MSELQKQLASLVDAANQREEEARKDATVEVLIKVMSAQYNKAVAYVNILVIGGFASFYAVWGKMYNTLDQFLMPLAGLLMTLAVIIFILWEIYKMIFYSTNLKRWNEITNEKNPKNFFKSINEQELIDKRRSLGQLKVWYVVLIFTLLPGLSAAGIFIYSFTKYIYNKF